MKILVGECSSATRTSLEAMFNTLNQPVEFATAADFSHAVLLAGEDEYGLIVLDRGLPGLDAADRLIEINKVAGGTPVLLSSQVAPQSGGPFTHLTRREREVLERVADGLSNKQIARELDLQEVTIKAHLRQVFRKLDVANRTQAASLVLNARKLV